MRLRVLGVVAHMRKNAIYRNLKTRLARVSREKYDKKITPKIRQKARGRYGRREKMATNRPFARAFLKKN